MKENTQMQQKALIVIDIQNDITKNYKDVIDSINAAVAWAVANNLHVVYIRHEYLTPSAKTFLPNTHGSELVPDLKIASENIFTKHQQNALTSDAFADFISRNEIRELYITGADATACVKSTCYNLRKAGHTVNVLTDCITSYDKKKIDEMLRYYESKGCNLTTLSAL